LFLVVLQGALALRSIPPTKDARRISKDDGILLPPLGAPVLD
jgi:hypothetical protein